MLPYYYFYGFGNRWLLIGIGLWLVAGLLSKALKEPVYKAIETLASTDVVRLNEERRKLNNGNVLQAILNCIAFGITAVPFINR